MKRESRRPI